jgi:hypothetical protein
MTRPTRRETIAAQMTLPTREPWFCGGLMAGLKRSATAVKGELARRTPRYNHLMREVMPRLAN